MHVWRLAKTRYATNAFDGEGARLYGARWSSPGTRVAYAAGNSALAVLEVLVHTMPAGRLPAYSLITASIPDSLVENVPEADLPQGWSASPVPPEAQAVGDAWIGSGRSLGLRVPSAIVPDSYNILINPQHRDFGRLAVASPVPFRFDQRLLR